MWRGWPTGPPATPPSRPSRGGSAPRTSPPGSPPPASRPLQVNDLQGLIDHPQLAERDRWRTVDTPAGEVRALLPPTTFRDVELPMGAVPALGADTAAILGELGYSADTIAELRRAGVIGDGVR